MAIDPTNEKLHILPADIPTRTSSHQQHVFQDASGNPISPSSPPRRRSSIRPMSGTVDAQSASSYMTALGKQPVGQYRPQSSHFPASTSASQAYTTAGAASQPKTHSRSRSKPAVQALQMQPPSHISLKSLSDELQPQKQATWSPRKEKILLGPFDYLYGHPGKDIRAQLIAAFNAWLRVPEASLSIITKVVGMLHTASLL
jgi:geranylgeranyl diphosphate synthase type 3